MHSKPCIKNVQWVLLDSSACILQMLLWGLGPCSSVEHVPVSAVRPQDFSEFLTL